MSKLADTDGLASELEALIPDEDGEEAPKGEGAQDGDDDGEESPSGPDHLDIDGEDVPVEDLRRLHKARKELEEREARLQHGQAELNRLFSQRQGQARPAAEPGSPEDQAQRLASLEKQLLGERLVRTENEMFREIKSRETLSDAEKLAEGLMRLQLARDPNMSVRDAATQVEKAIEAHDRKKAQKALEKQKQRAQRKTTGASAPAAVGKKREHSFEDYKKGRVAKSMGDEILSRLFPS
jgi:hypothetical protein